MTVKTLNAARWKRLLGSPNVIVCVAIVVSVACWLAVEVVDLKSVKDLIKNIALSTIAGSIFYFFTVSLPKRRDEQNLSPYVRERTFLIINHVQHFMFMVELKGLGRQLSDHITAITREELQEAFGNLSPNEYSSIVSLNQVQMTWIQSMLSVRQGVLQTFQEVLPVAGSVDTHLFKLMTDVVDCRFFSTIIMHATYQINNPDILFLADPYWDFLERIRILLKYHDEKFGKL